MKKIMIHYYTGTGNTEHAAKVMKIELEKLGHSVETIRVTHDGFFENRKYDLHIVMYPVFALTIPYGLEKYLKKLPNGNGVKAAVIANHGMVNMKGGVNTGYEGPGTLIAKKILKHRGYDVFFTGAVGYPENITILADRINEKDTADIIENADEKIGVISVKLADNVQSIKKYNFIGKFFSYLFGFIFTYAGRWHLGKMFIADKICNACGVCIKNCPKKAIRLFNKKPRWNFNCDACLGCYNICPKIAVQASIFRLVFGIIITVLSVFITITTFSFLINFFSGIIRPDMNFLLKNILAQVILWILVFIAEYLVIFYVTEKLIFFIEQIPVVRLLFEMTWTKKIKRYWAPK